LEAEFHGVLLKDYTSNNKPKLLEQVRITMRAAHYSKSTEESYISWIKRFILFHSKRHPKDMGASEIRQFINDLAVSQYGSAST